jgi:hypothetical protein
MPTRDDLDRLCLTLQNSSSAAADISKEIDILQSLRHKSMTVRHSKIVEAHNKTFDWVFNAEKLPPNDVRSKIRFNNWLQIKSGIFWVSGKAGSGKSTLMKYICDDPRTEVNLRHWAGTSNLVTASFYFWNAGTDMQKSQQGLLQSLLYEILSKCPDLIPTVCQPRWETKEASNRFQRSGPWGPTELTRAFERLQCWASPTRKFCFFIDGLDEYEGDHFELLDTMVNIVKSPHIKLCLSSRPWNCFEDVLGKEVDRKLYLQDLTRDDIEIYTRTKLKRPASWTSTYKDRVQHQEFALEIVERAQGVFLWVFLVVRSLQEGLANGDSISMLQSRLRALPTDLEPFFEHILRSVDRVYQEKLGGMFQVALQANEPLSLLTYSFLDEEDPDFSIKLPPSPLALAETRSRKDDTRRRINGRSKGLLEVSTVRLEDTTVIHSVDFLHRTVRDFLTTKSMHLMLKEMAPSTYNACFALSRALLANLKTIPRTHSLENEYELLNDALEYARRAEDQRGIADSPMVEELERTSKVRFHLFLESRNAFLGYTIERGLVQYVNGKLNQQPQLLLLERGILLSRALGKPLLGGRWEINLAPMVQMLLKRGLNPNDPLQRGTVWQQFFLSYPSVEAETKEHQYWRSILRLLLLRAANVRVSYKLIDLMMTRNEMFQSTSISSNELVHTVELLLSYGLDPNQSLYGKRSIWTVFLERICDQMSFWEEDIIHGVAKAFLRYGADPLASYCQHSEDTTEIHPVSKALEIVISCVKDEEERLTMEKLIKDETNYFKSRERYKRRVAVSQPRESSRKPQSITLQAAKWI